MEHTDALRFLNRALLEEMPELRTQAAEYSQGKAMALRKYLIPPLPFAAGFLGGGVLGVSGGGGGGGRGATLLPVIASNPKLALWGGGYHTPGSRRHCECGQQLLTGLASIPVTAALTMPSTQRPAFSCGMLAITL